LVKSALTESWCDPSLKRKLGHTAVRKKFLADMGYAYSTFFVTLIKHLRDKSLDPLHQAAPAAFGIED
jgi:hypothetical protein